MKVAAIDLGPGATFCPFVLGPEGVPVVTDLQKALLQQFRIRLDYAKKGKGAVENYEVDPYTLVFHKGGIYLLGRRLHPSRAGQEQRDLGQYLRGQLPSRFLPQGR